jgi:alkylation response protein AidB-like acyl-CoA dehydrogenase
VTATVTSTLARIGDLLPVISSRADEIEQGRDIPADLFADLVRAGCARMLVPARYGGDDIGLPAAVRVIEALARADGSTGWVIGVLSATPLILGHLPRDTFERLYADGPDILAAGALAPRGAATRQDGGWRVTGQWPFTSGCRHAGWIYLHCRMYEGGSPAVAADGSPVLRMMLFPVDEVRILDTWDSVGLRGTASHDVRVSGALCPAERSGTLFGGTATVAGSVFAVPLNDQLGLFIASVALGVAASALDHVTGVARGGKRPAFSTTRLAASAIFQDRLGEAHMSLLAARALLYGQAEAAWARAEADQPPDPLERAALRATGATVTTMAARIVDTAYTLGGGTAAYSSSPLQRCLRDVHTATQHAVTGREFLGAVGAVLAGADPATPRA